MIQFGKHQRIGDHIFSHETHQAIPEGMQIQVKGNRHGQIEDIFPRQIGKVDLYSKYYHRDAVQYVSQLVSEFISLIHKN